MLRDQLQNLNMASAKAALPRGRRAFYAKRTWQDHCVRRYVVTEIAEVFCTYYEKLYNIADSERTGEDEQAISHCVTFSSIYRSLVSLDWKKRKWKVLKNLLELKNSNKPFPSLIMEKPPGLHTSHYKAFKDVVGPCFIDDLTQRQYQVPPWYSLGFIFVIPKEGKDALNWASYRPISLLNSDQSNNLHEILANRLVPYLRFIHVDHVGFVRTWEAQGNTNKVLDLIYRAGDSGRPFLLLAKEAEKAFIYWTRHSWRRP